jgi:hypothetical protein
MIEKSLKQYWLFLLWVISIPFYFWGGTKPDYYKIYVRMIPLPHPYPWDNVLLVTAISFAEIMFVYLIIRPATYNKSWLRALVAFLLFSMWFYYMLPGLMHAPVYLFYHAYCQAIIIFVLLCMFIVAIFQKILAKNKT